MKPTVKGRQGFGSPGFNKDRQRAIASMGGKAGHAKGTAHEWTREEARIAGRKGGLARAERRAAKKASAATFAAGVEFMKAFTD